MLLFIVISVNDKVSIDGVYRFVMMTVTGEQRQTNDAVGRARLYELFFDQKLNVLYAIDPTGFVAF